MKFWITLVTMLLAVACANNGTRPPSTSSRTSSHSASASKYIGTQAGGITVSAYGEGASRKEAQKTMLRRAIKEVLPHLVVNIFDVPELTKTIPAWLDEQQDFNYEDLVKRWAFDIDTAQGDEHLLEGKVILNQAFLESKVNAYLRQCRRNKTCGGRLSIYIAQDASVPLSKADMKLAKSFMYSLQEHFQNKGFEIKKANQQKEAQYQLKLIELIKEKNNLNLNAHFTVEVLDNRAAGAVFTTKKGAASAPIVVGGEKVAENKVLARAASQISPQLMYEIMRNNANSEVIFYAKGNDYPPNVELQLATRLADLYDITIDDFIDPQITHNNGFTSWSFEFTALKRPSVIRLKAGIAEIQTELLHADIAQVISSKAGKKWSSYDSKNAPLELQDHPGTDLWTLEVEQLIREGKLDAPPGEAYNAYDKIKAQPDHPNATRLLHKLSEVLARNAETALDKKHTLQAKRYANRAKTIWPKNPQLSALFAEIARRPSAAPKPSAAQIIPSSKAKPNPELGKQVIESGRYFALLIGNQDYQGDHPLATPLADLRSLQQVLENDYGFDVTAVENGDQKTMEKALYSMQQKVGKNDSLLIFYAGHGYQEEGFSGKGFWIPVDGMSPVAENLDYLSTWVPNSLVHDIIQASEAKHVLLISDSCFSGTFKVTRRGMGRQHASTPVTTGLSPALYGLASLNSRKAISSGDLEPVSDGGGHGHSIFAYHLLNVLSEKKAISANDLFKKMRQPIVQASAQHPQYFIIDSNKDVGGDFIFVPK